MIFPVTWIMRVLSAIALMVITHALCPALAHAQIPARTHLKNTPCPGCIASIPDGSDPVPLIVALHGDYQNAVPVHDAWEKLAAPRGVAVLALVCPVRLGCAGSYWRWNGASSWIDEQIAKLAERRPLDRERLWLVGWSGGASYAGYRTQELERTFAAIVIHGGGIPPEEPSCGEPKPGIYFLVGDKNPLHSLSIGLREYYDRCGNAVTWDLVRGADHPGEWNALGKRGGVILDWLATQRRTANVANVANVATLQEATPDAGPTVVPQASASPAATASSANEPPGRTMPPRGCACGTTPQNSGMPMALVGSVFAAALLVVRRTRRSRVLVLPLLALVVSCSGASPVPQPAGERSPSPSPPASAAATARDAGRTDLTPTDAGVDAAPPARRAGAYANLDPDDDYVVGPPDALADCEGDLTRAGVTFKAASLPVHTPKRSKITCGAPQVVTYLRGPGNIAYNAAPLLTCSMALALASFERILQKEALAIVGSPVARIDQIGTYSCREVAAYPGLVSEHSYANAMDVLRFVLKNGTSIEVLRDFDQSENAPKKPGGAFLRVVSRRANDEDVFSHILTPFFNATHRNHFHLDLARYRNDGTRPQ